MRELNEGGKLEKEIYLVEMNVGEFSRPGDGEMAVGGKK